MVFTLTQVRKPHEIFEKGSKGTGHRRGLPVPIYPAQSDQTTQGALSPGNLVSYKSTGTSLVITNSETVRLGTSKLCSQHIIQDWGCFSGCQSRDSSVCAAGGAVVCALLDDSVFLYYWIYSVVFSLCYNIYSSHSFKTFDIPIVMKCPFS